MFPVLMLHWFLSLRNAILTLDDFYLLSYFFVLEFAVFLKGKMKKKIQTIHCHTIISVYYAEENKSSKLKKKTAGSRWQRPVTLKCGQIWMGVGEAMHWQTHWHTRHRQQEKSIQMQLQDSTSVKLARKWPQQ